VATLARFLISLLNLCSVSDQRAANGGMMAGVNKAKTNNPIFNPMRENFTQSAWSSRIYESDGWLASQFAGVFWETGAGIGSAYGFL
jgi:hypothetical protein